MAIDLQKCRDNFHKRAAAQQAAREKLRLQAHAAATTAILAVAPTYPDVTHIYLFGSVTQPNCFGQRSDLDIAVVGTDAASYFALWRDLEAACPDWAIDLREINQPGHFADMVRQTGALIYDA